MTSLRRRKSKILTLKKNLKSRVVKRLPLLFKRMTIMRASSHGRSTVTSAKTVATSCAARAAPKSPITSVWDSKWHQRASGGARIALQRRLQPRRSRQLAGYRAT